MVLTDVLLTLTLCFLIAAAAGTAFLVSRAVGSFMEFVSPRGEGKPSPLGEFIQGVCDMLAGGITEKINASLMGRVSGLTRGVAGAEADVVEDMLAAKSPLLAGLLALSPKLGRRLAKNPMLAMALSNLSLFKNAAPGNGSTSNPSVAVEMVSKL